MRYTRKKPSPVYLGLAIATITCFCVALITGGKDVSPWTIAGYGLLVLTVGYGVAKGRREVNRRNNREVKK